MDFMQIRFYGEDQYYNKYLIYYNNGFIRKFKRKL